MDDRVKYVRDNIRRLCDTCETRATKNKFISKQRCAKFPNAQFQIAPLLPL